MHVARLFLCLLAFQGEGWSEPEKPAAPQIKPEPLQLPVRMGTPVNQFADVWIARDPQAIQLLEPDAARVAPMVHALVMAVAGKESPEAAWRSLFQANQKVGIKVSAAGGPGFSTRIPVVRAVLDGLGMAGIPRKNVIVWDRDAALLRASGFTTEALGCQVRGIEQPAGYDGDAKISAPVVGKLIWGDVLFHRIKKPGLGERILDSEQISSRSYMATVLSKSVSHVINLPVLVDHEGCGFAGALYNMTVPNLDNWRRFTQADGAEGIAIAYADERIRSKVVFHLLDGLIGQYAGGPARRPYYASEHATLYASRDPVALDTVAIRWIDEQRLAAKMSPASARATYLAAAAASKLGVADDDRIRVRSVMSRSRSLNERSLPDAP